VDAALRIKQVADASGFTTAALRYYERIGLLPEASRTAAGYRTYDERTLDRLAFISRAKQLGCTLEEITGPTAAWDGGRCGPIQEELRRLVGAKMAAAQAQMVELMTFTHQLRRAAAALEAHRPEGACDDECGCLEDVDSSATAPAAIEAIEAVTLSAGPPAPGEPAIACGLDAGSMHARIADWRALLDHVDRREPVDGGIRCVFAPSVDAAQLMLLVAAEQDCCQFFRFTITVDPRGVALEVRAPANALPIVESLFGTSS
jgi:MerR family copper efflux transcriptional regulator